MKWQAFPAVQAPSDDARLFQGKLGFEPSSIDQILPMSTSADLTDCNRGGGVWKGANKSNIPP